MLIKKNGIPKLKIVISNSLLLLLLLQPDMSSYELANEFLDFRNIGLVMDTGLVIVIFG